MVSDAIRYYSCSVTACVLLSNCFCMNVAFKYLLLPYLLCAWPTHHLWLVDVVLGILHTFFAIFDSWRLLPPLFMLQLTLASRVQVMTKTKTRICTVLTMCCDDTPYLLWICKSSQQSQFSYEGHHIINGILQNPDSTSSFLHVSLQCGFSRLVVQILNMHGRSKCPYKVCTV